MDVVKPLNTYVSLLHIAPLLEPDWAVGACIQPLDVQGLTAAAGSSWFLGQHKLLQQNVLASTFNEDLANGWTYGWASGRSQAIRECLHQVKAYVFEISPVSWRLVAKVVSPGFTIETYRNASKATTKAASPLGEPAESKSPLLSLSTSSLGHMSNNTGDDSPRHVSSRTQIMANHLGILALFLEATSVSSVPPEWSQRLLQHLLGRPQEGPVPSSCIKLTAMKMTDGALPQLHQVAANWLVHLFHPHNIGQYEAVILAHRECISERAELLNAYNDCVHLIYRISESILEAEAKTTVARLARTIAHHFPALETQLARRIATEGHFGYHATVAHFREVALVRPDDAFSPMPHLRVEHAESNGRQHSGQLAVARYATMIYMFQMHVHDDRLFIESKWKVYPSEPSVFVLDNHPRVLRTFPNGESTMAGSSRGIDGDYVGYKSPAGIHLSLYHYDLDTRQVLRFNMHLAKQGDDILQVGVTCYRLAVEIDEQLVYSPARERTALWMPEQSECLATGDLMYRRNSTASPPVVMV
ncbi:hypothetical protein ACHHYP_09980 [Achlya hypogyna]|uniref:Uncharacterized protein n=1 Tax=Achlya hypogyna TaxID=1202772 RepID=A0A1V9YM31_ACHHY|nr:hypothetical protein ACHHYP_09980 [Achlya hypogyna]